MKRKAAFLIFLFVSNFSTGRAQITTLDSLNTFLSGKWIYTGCYGGLPSPCPYQIPPNRTTIFAKTTTDSTFVQVYQNNSLIASRDIQASWNISSQVIDPVFGYRAPFLGIYWYAYSIWISDANHIQFQESNCADCFTYSYTRDTTYGVNCNNNLSVSSTILQPLSCRGASDATLRFNVGGGTSPFSYFWSNGLRASSAGGLREGTYSVTVTGFDGCTASASQFITAPFRCFNPHPVIQFPLIPLPGQH